MGTWDNIRNVNLFQYDQHYTWWDTLPMTSQRYDPKRQTGRTSDMLWEAANAKDEGPVLVIVHTERMVEHCLRSLNGAWWGLERPDFISVQSAEQWRGWRFPDGVFIDHFVHELAREDRRFTESYLRLMENVNRGKSAYPPMPTFRVSR